MQLNFNNLNQLWSYVLTETLKRLGLSCAILCPGSNADLGLIRALAVVKELQKAQNQTRLSRFKKVQFRAYSAAQLFLPENQGFAKKNTRKDPATRGKRRRIEIRFAQLGEYVTPDEN